MGGFEGGDEGGFWDEDSIANLIDKQNSTKSKQASSEKPPIQTNGSSYSIRAHAKITIFLKITGYKENSPTLCSRLVRVDDLYDTISFVPASCENFSIEGCDDIPLESNTIYKAYEALYNYTADSDIVDFFKEHKIVVKKRIPIHAGLGAAASNAAAFMHLLKEVCNLVLSTGELVKIGHQIGADLAFFIYNYPSANVSGRGEIVEAFKEDPLKFELSIPKLRCDPSLIHQTFKENFLKELPVNPCDDWKDLDSKSILKSNSDSALVNELFPAVLQTYPDLTKESKDNWFLSGSGPTFFRVT